MSDSDDTDILLLIPPDFFVAESNLEESLKYDLLDANVFKPIKLSPKTSVKPSMDSKSFSMEHEFQKSLSATPSASCLKKQSTYDGLDTCHLMTGGNHRNSQSLGNTNHRTVENNTRNNEFGMRTPKKTNNDNYLEEIDNYLAGSSSHTSKLRDINAILLSNGITPLAFGENKRNTHLGESSLARRSIQPNDMCTDNMKMDRIDNGHSNQSNAAAGADVVCQGLDAGRMSDWSMGLQQQNTMKADNPLVNLNQIWDSDKRENHQVDATSLNVHEEQLRRRQCERQIQGLQMQIKEYQEKFSVAIRIDMTKNEALARLHETNSRYI